MPCMLSFNFSRFCMEIQMANCKLMLICLSFLTLQVVDGANILVTVIGLSGSQNLIMYRLADLMGQRGHNVTVLNAVFFPEAKSIKLKYAKEIKYAVVTDEEALNEFRQFFKEAAWSQTSNSMVPIKVFSRVFRQIRHSCESLLDRQDFIQRLNHSHFDAVVIHMLDLCTFGLTRVLGIDAYAWMSTAFLFEPMAWFSGAPLAHGYVPNLIMPSNPNGHLSFVDRIKNTAISTFILGVFQYGLIEPFTDVFRKKYGPEFPHYGDIMRKTQLYFANSVPLFEYGRPIPENVINIGGLTMKKPEPLDKKWQEIMDKAPKEGVVIFSMGSIVPTSTMPQEIRLAFLNAFKRFPHLFIWRFEGDFPEAQGVHNVHISTWLPQKDLMAHPNVKAAIIHGGYNSLTETTYLGVPVIVMPMFGDQFANAAKVTRHNIGVVLNRQSLTEQSVYQALTKVLYDEKIQANAHRLGEMIREKPFSSLQQATEWLEYLAKFKRLDQLQPQSHELYLFQYLLLDILLFLLVVVGVILALMAVCVKICLRVCKKRKTGKRKGKENEGKRNKEKKMKKKKGD